MSRGWEKPGLSKTPVLVPDGIPSILASMKDEQKACHRAAFLHFLQSMVSAGSDVEANLADGTVYKASFYTSTPFKGEEFKIALKNAKPVGKSNADGKTIVVPGKSFASIKVSSLDLAPRGAGGRELQTDSSIRGRDVSHLEGRELQTASAWLDPSTMTELEGSSNGKSNEPFNQFDVNKRLFGVQSTYSEDIYTKSLDTSKMTKAQLEKAERLAREIESQQSSNIHMQEERGHALEREIDEEDLYSGVLRQPNEKESVWKRGVPQKVNTPSPKQGQPSKTKTANSGKVENNTSGKTKKIDGANTPPGLDITTKEVNIAQPQKTTPSPSLTQEVANMEINEDKSSNKEEKNTTNDNAVDKDKEKVIKETGFKLNAKAVEWTPKVPPTTPPLAPSPMLYPQEAEMMDSQQYMESRILSQGGQRYGGMPPMHMQQMYAQNQGMGMMMDGRMGMPMPQYPQPPFYQPNMQFPIPGPVMMMGPGGPMVISQPTVPIYQNQGYPMGINMGGQGQFHHNDGGRGNQGRGNQGRGNQGRGNQGGRERGTWNENNQGRGQDGNSEPLPEEPKI